VKYPDTEIPSWTTLDLGLAWRSQDAEGYLSGARVSLNIQNLADEDPPIVLSGANAVDLANHNVFGRIYTFEVTKRF
jgi:iron complex outermembrane receptor protein